MEQVRVRCRCYYSSQTVGKETIWIYVFGIFGEDTFDCLVLDTSDQDQLIPRAIRAEMLIEQVEPSTVPELLRWTVEESRKIVRL